MKNTIFLLAVFACQLVLLAAPVSVAAQQAQSKPQIKMVANQRLFVKAKECLGREMWKPGYGLDKGTLGCAAALCNVLKEAGNGSVHSALVTVVRRQLLASPNRCTELIVRNGEGREIEDSKLLKLCQPGDILLAFLESPSKLNGGPNAHCGIMGQGTQVLTNNWNDGIWTQVEIHQMFDSYPYVRLLRFVPPAGRPADVKPNK
ncbi:hypothetical protein BH11CYA1_BH11CYA1_15230 [soil metagenome]